MIDLREYQKTSVGELVDKVGKLLLSTEGGICVLKAPTGLGKTVIVAEFLKQLVASGKARQPLSFIWISVRKLHDQSKDKLQRYYEGSRLLKCSYFEDLQDRRIGENEILFLNWESINKKEVNIYIRESEQENNLSNIIENTKAEGRQIMLVIDESHYAASSEKSRELITAISPKVTLEVSATPQLQELISEIVRVTLSDVKDEEMIKTEISINPEFTNVRVDNQSTDEFVVGQAMKKREELVREYKKEGSAVNPLVLIQLPDKREGLEDKKVEIEGILRTLGITEESGRMAVWLSEEKSETLPNIEKNDNEVEVLIFKQAIALGWDCPRASILIIFRESKSFTFTIQTIGRIMRMPELKHYRNKPELNKGFVFTNLSNLEIAEEYAKDYVTVYESKRKDETYRSIALPSIYLKRQRERTRLSGEFVKIYLNLATELGLRRSIRLEPSKVVNPVMSDGKIIDIDQTGEVEQKGSIDIVLTEKELQRRFDRFIWENCSPYAPVDSSDRLKVAIYSFFENELGMERFDPRVQRIVLGRENAQYFVESIAKAKERYKSEVVAQLAEKRELQRVEKWEVPLLISYNSHYRQQASPRSIMHPLYVRDPSEPERDFIHALDRSDKVEWWFKNGENEIKFFAVNYRDQDGYPRAFYPDFIVRFLDSSLGIFDTKAGITARDAGPRAKGLWEFIRTNAKTRRVWGGIVVHENNTWLYNDEEDYNYNPPIYSGWKTLSLA